jgi:hypothetical protein
VCNRGTAGNFTPKMSKKKASFLFLLLFFLDVIFFLFCFYSFLFAIKKHQNQFLFLSFLHTKTNFFSLSLPLLLYVFTFLCLFHIYTFCEFILPFTKAFFTTPFLSLSHHRTVEIKKFIFSVLKLLFYPSIHSRRCCCCCYIFHPHAKKTHIYVLQATIFIIPLCFSDVNNPTMFECIFHPNTILSVK